MNFRLFFARFAPALVVSALALNGTAHAADSCDRACLEGFVDKYLDAELAHDPTQAPFAKNAKFTENGQKLAPGDGLWRTMTGKGAFRMFVADTHSGRVSFLGSIKEADVSAMIAVHLRVKDGQITEAETLVQRNDKSGPGFEKGKIRQIMAIMERVPYGMNSGWSSWEEGMSGQARDITKQR